MDNQKENLKMSDRFMIAMFSSKEYDKLLKEKTSKLVWFLILFILLLTVIRYVIPYSAMIAGMGGVKGIVMKEIPDFSLEEGKLTINKRIEKDDEVGGIYVLVDTDVECFQEKDVPADVLEAVLISQSNILVFNEYSIYSGKSQEMLFSDWKDTTLNNQQLADMAPFIYFMIGMFVVVLYFAELIKYLLSGVFFALFMTLYANALMHPADFGKSYKVAMYAQVIGTLVYAITCGFGNAMFMMAGSIFQIIISFVIMRKVLIPMERPTIRRG